jgi:hypothetical protein
VYSARMMKAATIGNSPESPIALITTPMPIS